jgi:hypothetical protein
VGVTTRRTFVNAMLPFTSSESWCPAILPPAGRSAGGAPGLLRGGGTSKIDGRDASGLVHCDSHFQAIDSSHDIECDSQDSEAAMPHITANDLKTRGIAAIEAQLAGGRTEAVVSVRGADRYVVMHLAQYQHLRECELEAALAESRADMAAGRFVAETAQAHVARVQAQIASEAGVPAKASARRARATKAAQPGTSGAVGRGNRTRAG